ncbi:adenine phosphoribosyltransferase [Robbsia sp. Bb-Pol-6]|uniref:Adenine phosphoribosyltransferase n=1 Tax=Robbsia betulipollinis TaxID=2981849 RepID=A0ABT3ZKY0_9BURK|nr:adenine phosphoribosyltransferase [Robbsia betulipollinis]MCY0387193.1 adenine phosphoribosyltransferase [Robbsia betulipollinis]
MVEQAERTAAQDASRIRSHIRSHIRTVQDWPQPGVAFRDITPLLSAPASLRLIVDALVARYRDQRVAHFAGLEARGFILAPLLAYELGAGFIPVRKQGKLPYRTLSQSYDLEYGQATLEVHVDACAPGERVVLIDDLIATGGTMLAARTLLERLGGEVLEGGAIIDLPALGGSARLRAAGLPLFTLCDF